MGGFLDRRWGRWGWQGCSVECTTRSDERVRTTSHNGVSWAVDRRCGLPGACVAVFEVATAVWVLDGVLVVVFRPFAAGVAVVVGSDVAVVTGGSGCGTGGWGLCWSVVGRPGSQRRHSRGTGACFEAGEGTVVAVVDSVDSTDGGCAAVVDGDVADNGGDDGLVGVSSLGAVCITASAVTEVVVWVLESTLVVEGWGTVSVDVPASLSGRGGSSQGAVWVTASAVEVEVVWELESVVARVVGSVCTSSSTRIHVRGSTHLPWPCFVSHTSRSVVFPFSLPSFSPLSYPSLSPNDFPASSCVYWVSSSIGP